MNQVVAIALGVSFLLIFYRTIKTSWPESYFVFGSTTDPIISRSLGRYLAYRTVPYFVVCLFIAVTLTRQATSALPASLATPLLHTVPLLVVSALSRRPKGLAPGQVALRIAVVALSLAAGYLAHLSRNTLDGLVPPLTDLTAAVWTGLFAAVIGAALLEMSSVASLDPETMVRNSRRNVSQDLIDLSRQTAKRYSVNPSLIHAIMIVEDAQRPLWVRRLERIRGRVTSTGTYGVMQVTADGPISDAESIEIACRDHLAGSTLRIERASAATSEGLDDPLAYPYVERDALVDVLKGYNRSSEYVDLISAVLDVLLDEDRAAEIDEALQRASATAQWCHLTSADALQSLAHQDPDMYLWFVRWLNGGPTGDLRGTIKSSAPGLAYLLDQVDMTDDRNSSLGRLWVSAESLATEIRNLAEAVGLSEVPLAEDPKFDPPKPNSHTPGWTEVVWLGRLQGMFGGSAVFVSKVELTVPEGGLVWIGGYAGVASLTGVVPVEGSGWDFERVQPLSTVVKYSDATDSSLDEIRGALAAVLERIAAAVGPAFEAVLSIEQSHASTPTEPPDTKWR